MNFLLTGLIASTHDKVWFKDSGWMVMLLSVLSIIIVISRVPVTKKPLLRGKWESCQALMAEPPA
jgi:hypothetical protein